MNNPPAIGIAGLGGFSLEHHRAILHLEDTGEARVLCTTGHGAACNQEAVSDLDLERRGVAVFSNFDDMLDASAHTLDLVIVPTPIPLHAPMHKACVARDLPCYLEKPPTLYAPELRQMLHNDLQASKATFVGFNFMGEPIRRMLKMRLLAGEFGPLKRVSYLGLWARSESYYQRASWAGKLKLDGFPVLDSCLGNAMSHMVFNCLHWASTDGLYSWAEVARLQAELYRANPICSADTMFVQGVTTSGVELRLAGSHACDQGWIRDEILVCEGATITYRVGDCYKIEWHDGRTETKSTAGFEPTLTNLRNYLSYLKGERQRPLVALGDTCSFVDLYGLMFVAAGRIATVPDDAIYRIQRPKQCHFSIRGLSKASQLFIRDGAFPSETVAWGRAGGHASREDLGRLSAVLAEMCKQAEQKSPVEQTNAEIKVLAGG